MLSSSQPGWHCSLLRRRLSWQLGAPDPAGGRPEPCGAEEALVPVIRSILRPAASGQSTKQNIINSVARLVTTEGDVAGHGASARLIV